MRFEFWKELKIFCISCEFLRHLGDEKGSGYPLHLAKRPQMGRREVMFRIKDQNQTARVNLVGRGRVVEAEVEPSLTVRQLLEQMGCSDDKYVVEGSVRGKNHKPHELVADIIPAGGELSVSPHFDAGG